MYYLILTASAVLFSFVFIFSDKYRERYGAGSAAALKFTAGSHFAGLIALFIINRFHFEINLFTSAVALAAAADVIVFNLCSLRALERTNLSVYSVLSMIGGMALPFAAGIIFFGEEITAGKIICLVLIGLSLLLTIRKTGEKGSVLLYAGVFITNGMYGVINKLFASSDIPKTSDAAYSMLIESFTVIISLALLVFIKEKAPKTEFRALAYMGGYGAMCAVGNYFLLIALSVLSASAQYPFVTGGVMIISTVYAFFTPAKPGKKEILSIILALGGIAALITL